ncbi:MAG TPA: (2Fe-2S)-binding protein [Fodinibius sp.]|nr:(2Fe-2S)-binding protein [Fodinibius sp.]
MNDRRIQQHPVLGNLESRKELSFTFDGNVYKGYEGDTIASALLAHGIRQLRVHEKSGNPRGIYCNIGHCFECRVTVDGKTGVRACMTEIREDMVVESGGVLPDPLDSSQRKVEDMPRTYAEFISRQETDEEEDSDV